MKPGSLSHGSSTAWGKALRRPAALQPHLPHVRTPPTPRRAHCPPIRCGQVPKTPFEGFVARPPNSELHLGNAWSLAHACELSYLTQDEVRSIAEGRWGLKGLLCYGYGDNDGPDTQCFAAAGPDFIVVAFRGTTSITDWVRDLKVWKLPDGPLGCEAHAGFLEGVQGKWKGRSIIDSVLQGVRDLERQYGKEEGLAIYVTGHSLGGALATLAAAYMLEDPELRDKVAGHYTFGSPRVAGPRFKKRFEALAPAGRALAHRFQNREDVVSKVPAWWRAYDHVGRWWYLAGDDQVLMRNPDLWTRLRDIIDIDWDFQPDFVYDHQLRAEGTGGYIDGIEKNIVRSA
ncbi:unnamed protein product [Ostreobium quekettii]|uniref:Fungal lipase-type domain-containing protein n=1 Tax=Ostreobium quekettii TaxID=121088 RepID=A0A8S1IQU3_9CHLO|nr:unnamed protein product [Ostreobium quekettii]|eukprot:evm.model.scf_119EXC.2 EVM.evm.TU.scf_119EXC.2   scf_119EXC:9169-10387(+)